MFARVLTVENLRIDFPDEAEEPRLVEALEATLASRTRALPGRSARAKGCW